MAPRRSWRRLRGDGRCRKHCTCDDQGNVRISVLIVISIFTLLLALLWTLLAWRRPKRSAVLLHAASAIVVGLGGYALVGMKLSAHTSQWIEGCLANGGDFATDCDPGVWVYLSNPIVPAPLLVFAIVGLVLLLVGSIRFFFGAEA